MNILKSIQPVLERSKNVRVREEAIDAYVKAYDPRKEAHWLSVAPFPLHNWSAEEQLSFLFTLDSMSCSYWAEPKQPKWRIEYNGKLYDGAQAMMACLGRAREEGRTYNPQELATLSRTDLESILRGTTEIPLLDERLRIVNELGARTLQEFQGAYRSIIEEARGSATRLVEILVHLFSSFRDTAQYQGHEILFHKRAQLLAADVSQLFDLDDVEKLTACADYKLPQVLRRHGILDYAEGLRRRILAQEEIAPGSEEEIAIRANTIHAVELLKARIGTSANAVNDALWLEGQVRSPRDEPYHRTRTTAY